MRAYLVGVRRELRSRMGRHARFLVACMFCAIAATPALPAPTNSFAQPGQPTLPDTATRMLLEADELLYDFDAETINAIGNVKIYYRGYVLDAERVTYNQKSGRLIATGGVRMLEPGGNILTSERLDITDDFLQRICRKHKPHHDRTARASRRAAPSGATAT